MRKAQHKPPSRVRYEQSHPAISCRLNKETYDLLKQQLEELGDVSVCSSRAARDSPPRIKMPKPEDTERVREEATREGYSQAIREWQIWYYCNVCKKKVTVKPNSVDHKRIIGFAKQNYWAHESCLPARKEKR